MKKILITTIMAAGLIVPAMAQTTDFTNASATDSFLSNAGNWSAGLPDASTPGTISVNANVGAATLTDFVVTQSAGDITLGSFPNTNFELSGATASWTMNGGTITVRSHNTLNGATFTLNNGKITNVNGNDVLVNASTFIMNGGEIDNDEDILVRDGAILTINGGIVDTPQRFGMNTFGTASTMNLNGGTITGGRFVFKQTGSVANFGVGSGGSATFADWGTGLYSNSGDRQEDNDILLNFLAGTNMTLSLSSAARALDFTNDSTNNPYGGGIGWAQALWETDRLLYDGDDFTTLGLDWATVTSTGFGDGNYFDFTADGSFGGSLLVAPVPEPSTALLLIGGLAGLALLRRKRQ
jgi:hypothetical protein